MFYLTSPQSKCNMIRITNQHRRIKRTSRESFCINMKTNIPNNSSITSISPPHRGCQSLSTFNLRWTSSSSHHNPEMKHTYPLISKTIVLTITDCRNRKSFIQKIKCLADCTNCNSLDFLNDLWFLQSASHKKNQMTCGLYNPQVLL